MNPYVGHDTQLSGCYRFVYDDGALKGTQAVEVYNETGLRFTVLLGRGMDIAYASYKALPLLPIFKTAVRNGDAHSEAGWLRRVGSTMLAPVSKMDARSSVIMADLQP